MQITKDRVLIEPMQEGEKTTPSGIIIPETAEKHGLLEGVVVEVGPGRYEQGQLVPMQAQKGQKVLYDEGYSSKKIKFEGKEYVIIRDEDICIIL